MIGTGVRAGANSISASPVPRNDGSIPSTRPVNAPRTPAIAGALLAATVRPSSLAFHISLTDIRGMALSW